MAEKVQIRLYPDGRIEAETLGMQGEKCTDVIALLEQLLNAEVVETNLKPEYHEIAEVKTKARQSLKWEE